MKKFREMLLSENETLQYVKWVKDNISDGPMQVDKVYTGDWSDKVVKKLTNLKSKYVSEIKKLKTADVKSKGWEKHPDDVASSCAIVLVNKDGEEYYLNGSTNKLYWSVSGTKRGWIFKTTSNFLSLDSTYDNKQFGKKLEDLSGTWYMVYPKVI